MQGGTAKGTASRDDHLGRQIPDRRELRQWTARTIICIDNAFTVVGAEVRIKTAAKRSVRRQESRYPPA